MLLDALLRWMRALLPWEGVALHLETCLCLWRGQVLELEDSLSPKDHYEKRPRVCNLGYLRTPFQRPDGKVAYRCASEPIDDYVKKGGCETRIACRQIPS